MVAAIEPGSDFAALLERYGVGRAAPFGDAATFQGLAEALAAGPSVATSAERCLDEVFHVRRAVAVIQGATGGQSSTAKPI